MGFIDFQGHPSEKGPPTPKKHTFQKKFGATPHPQILNLPYTKRDLVGTLLDIGFDCLAMPKVCETCCFHIRNVNEGVFTPLQRQS